MRELLSFKLRVIISFVLWAIAIMLVYAGCQSCLRWWENLILLSLGLAAVASGIKLIIYSICNFGEQPS